MFIFLKLLCLNFHHRHWSRILEGWGQGQAEWDWVHDEDTGVGGQSLHVQEALSRRNREWNVFICKAAYMVFGKPKLRLLFFFFPLKFRSVEITKKKYK